MTSKPNVNTTRFKQQFGGRGGGGSSMKMLIRAGNAITVFTEFEASGAPSNRGAPRDRTPPHPGRGNKMT